MFEETQVASLMHATNRLSSVVGVKHQNSIAKLTRYASLWATFSEEKRFGFSTFQV